MYIGITPKIDYMEINMYKVFHKPVWTCAFVGDHWYVICKRILQIAAKYDLPFVRTFGKHSSRKVNENKKRK